MCLPFSRWKSRVLLALLLAFAFLFPTLVSAGRVNLAHAQLARAYALPLDAPDRTSALAHAQNEIQNARDSGAARALPPIPARFALAQARWFSQHGDLLQVVNAIAGARALDADGIAQMLAGNAAYRLGDSARAVQHWRAAGAFEYFIRAAHRAQDRHLWLDAEYSARIAALIVPDSADAWYVLGDARARQNVNDTAALDALRRAERLTPDQELLSTIISRRGEIYADQNRLPEARGEFTRANQIAPLDARPRVGMALITSRGDGRARQVAIELLNQALADAPWYSAAYIAAASIVGMDQDAAEAERWLKKGLEQNPNNAELLYALGEFYARQKRMDDARAALISALRHATKGDDLLKIARTLEELNAR